jgi:hypothetical protein
MVPMPRDPFVREKFTRERTAARKLAVAPVADQVPFGENPGWIRTE